jgi:glycine dehydrogenase subunit 1
MKKKIVYPYIPNSVDEIKQEMLKKVGAKNAEELFKAIPEHLRIKGELNLPKAKISEIELKEFIQSKLKENISCEEYTNFLGAGCYDHYVPAVCDEINGRSEFLTAYCGETYSDHGKCQAIFEYTSLIGELVDMDVVGLATYDGGQSAGTAIRMAYRLTGRKEVLLSENISSQLMMQLEEYCDFMNLIKVNIDETTGNVDIEDLKRKISKNTACVFIENPSYLGTIEENVEEIGKIAKENGAEYIVSVDPSSLGVLEAPSNYGADIICGELQPLGIHMGYGSGLGGIIACRDEEKYIMNLPNHFYSLYENEKGEFGFLRSINSRTSYHSRENAVEYLGTNVGLWAITSAVYLSLMGPKGMYELGRNILYISNYAKKKLSQIKGIEIKFKEGNIFKEFIANFDQSGKTVKEINEKLLNEKIFGGKDLSSEFKNLGQSALYCVTEKTKKEDIDKLVQSLESILNS